MSPKKHTKMLHSLRKTFVTKSSTFLSMEQGDVLPWKKCSKSRKKTFFSFWAPHMQNFMLSSKITLLFCFGASGRRRKCLKIAKLYFCTFATSPLAALVCLTKFRETPGKPVQPVGWSQTCKNTILQFSNTSYAFQKPQNNKRRLFWGSVGQV